MNRLKLLIPMLFLLIFACNSKEEEIKEVGFWKYSEGAVFADVLNFKSEDYSIKNDTVFKLDIPEYRITSYERRVLSGDQVLQLIQLETGKTARYVSK
ncbi:hypothetical protein [Pedobacter xixiisoli]|uniref:Uncharacterized protein n=1 Tax=Pedobacter xixiisoli TaxID=1476464 RepID=A0A285ZQG1_9SPHI|nr:hypothetical protein [Pedobacter xixiisoli]SOD11865.1 hypothetical protein SAMN06297358_0372 [Pedobacter xixiisoli]